MPISVLIVDDEPEFLSRFTQAVLGDPALSLCAAVSSGAAALAVLGAAAPEVLLLDLGLPDMEGVEIIRHVAERHPGCDVLVVTMFGDDRHVMAALEAGATGYLLKDAGLDRISASIHELRAGGSPISPGIARRILARLRIATTPETLGATASTSPTSSANPGGTPSANPSANPSSNASLERGVLTQRETELLRLTAKGLSFDAIGQVLEISPHTVVAHVKKIYRKLAVHSRAEAVFEAGQLGLL